jgi:ABC-2 type transport system permease protein
MQQDTERVVPPQRVVEAPLAPPSANAGLIDVFRRHYVLRLLVRKEIQARYSGSFFGLFWSYVQPATKFFMYFFVMGIILQLHKNVEQFGIHMFAGLVFVHYFTETFNSGTRSIVRNGALVKKMAMPREMFPVASMLVSAFHALPGTVILMVAATAVGWRPDPVGVIAGLLGFLIVSMLGTALALLFSAANVFFRDFGSFVSILTTFVTFSVPMIYPYSLVDDRFGRFAEYYLVNPLAEVVLLSQRCFWVGSTVHPARTIRTNLPSNLFEIGLAHLLGAALFLVIAQSVFSKMENRFAERL